MIIHDGWNIHSLAASVGFNQTKKEDLAREYFVLKLIRNTNSGGALETEVVCRSERFQNYQDRFQVPFAIPEPGTDPAFWSRLDHLLNFFQTYNLFEVERYLEEVCPWIIADEAAFHADFPSFIRAGSRVAALAVVLRALGQVDEC